MAHSKKIAFVPGNENYTKGIQILPNCTMVEADKYVPYDQYYMVLDAEAPDGGSAILIADIRKFEHKFKCTLEKISLTHEGNIKLEFHGIWYR